MNIINSDIKLFSKIICTVVGSWLEQKKFYLEDVNIINQARLKGKLLKQICTIFVAPFWKIHAINKVNHTFLTLICTIVSSCLERIFFYRKNEYN
jgi:hypothetical protein